MTQMKRPSSPRSQGRSERRAFLQALFTPPTFADPQKNVLAQTLHYLLMLAVVLSGGYGVLTWFIATEPSGSILSGSMMAISLALFWQLRQRRIRLVSSVLVASGYLAIMTSLFMNGGIRDEAALVLIALLSIAGFLLGMQVVIPLGIITAVVLIINFFAERLELIPEVEHLSPVAVDELMLALIAVFVTTIILYQITRLMNRNTDQIEAQAKFLSERNIQLKETQTALIIAKEQAEEASRSRTVFFSRMSHDLRTPLSGLLGMVNHLLSDGTRLEPDEQQEFLQGIQRSGAHLLNLINDLLDIARLEAQQLPLHIHPTSLFTALAEVAMMLRHTAESKGLALLLQIDENIPETVYADEQRLQQIFINLVGNGIKFTDSGQVSLIVTAVSQESGGEGVDETAVSTIQFEVIDTGRGIAPQELEKIFDPFVQGVQDHLDMPGTGLGLAICRQLVEVMGGKLQVESALGQGSRFWFTLKLAAA